MRLLNVHTFELETFFDNIPQYAILSHCWEDEEVVFSDLDDLEQAKKKGGFTKVQKTCEVAIEDGLKWVWIDTCCIDKSSSAELSEAINSMFAWYKDCNRCYAYLADVELQGAGKPIQLSKWFTRAWTLQELLAPSNHQTYSTLPGMKFYSRDWQLLGDKINIGPQISEITGIPIEYLEGQSLETASISMRMSWAADRKATRSEDIAYSLLGIFDVNMPLLYGEGKNKAFRRLQEEIMKISEDETLFAWEVSDGMEMNELTADVLAINPNDFRETRDLIPFASDDPVAPYAMTHRGLRISQTLFHTHQLDENERKKIRPLRSPVMIWLSHDISWGILRCHVVHDFQHFVIVPLRHLSGDVYLRDVSTSVSLIPFGSVPSTAFTREIYIRNALTSTIQRGLQRRWGFLVRSHLEGIEIRQCYPKEAWNTEDNILQGKFDDAEASSWHAALDLSYTTVTKSGQIVKSLMFLALGCKRDEVAKKPKAWCHIDDASSQYSGGYLQQFHRGASSRLAQPSISMFHTDQTTGFQSWHSLEVTITPAKVLSQDMFVVDFQYAELQDPMNTGARSSHRQLAPPSTSIPTIYTGTTFHAGRRRL
ncbi:unnamed protein product [Alternaria alternata]|jgi:hypothetical protein